MTVMGEGLLLNSFLKKFWFFHFFLKSEERNVLGLEERRVKTDH